MNNSKHINPVEVVHGGEIRFRNSGITLQTETVWRILGEIAKDYPELNKPDTKERDKEQTFTLSALTETGQQKDLVMIRAKSINLATLDTYEDKVWKKRYSDILTRVAKGLRVQPLTITHIDSTLIVKWETCVNHPKILSNLLGLESGFAAGFSPMKLVYLDSASIFEVDPNEEIVCRIDVDSEVGVEQNKMEEYSKPKSLRIECGVAKRSNFTFDTSIDEVILKICSLSLEIFATKFNENIVHPISRFISQHEEGKKST